MSEPVSAFDFDFEIYELKSSDYKDLLYEEIMLYHSETCMEEYLANKQQYPDGILKFRYGQAENKDLNKESPTR